MTFDAILSRFTAAVEAGDGTALGALFTQDGIYHDTFYGEFHGPSAIKDMLENHFGVTLRHFDGIWMSHWRTLTLVMRTGVFPMLQSLKA